MTILRTSALAAAMVASAAAGMWARPYVIGDKTADTPCGKTTLEQPASDATTARTDAAKPRATEPTAALSATSSEALITPAMKDRLRPLLAKGSDMSIYAEGFPSVERFAAVAHASHNTGVPFMMLKDRVVNQQMSLGHAIRSTKPGIDWKLEADRAEIEARSDVMSTRPLF